jgi:hypothetical protein
MDIKEKIWEIIEEYDNVDIDECIGAIEDYLKDNPNVKSYKMYSDTDVFDSCGLDIYYISVSWIDVDGNLDICGSKIERY